MGRAVEHHGRGRGGTKGLVFGRARGVRRTTPLVGPCVCVCIAVLSVWREVASLHDDRVPSFVFGCVFFSLSLVCARPWLINDRLLIQIPGRRLQLYANHARALRAALETRRWIWLLFPNIVVQFSGNS